MSSDPPELANVTDYELFIDGEYRSSASDERIAVDFPFTGEVWATVPSGREADVDRAVEAARGAFEAGWRDAMPSERRTVLTQIADVFDEHYEELGRLESLQNGKLIREMEGQMRALGEWYRYYAGLCDGLESDVIPVENKDGQFHNFTVKEPYGVVGGITPWNSPLLLTTFKLAPALAAGNTFVHKPSEQTPVSALRFAELVHAETDLPDGVYNVVTGYGRETGAPLAEHEDVDKVAFTGSTSVGREIAKNAGERLIPASLELGGKSPNIVFPDANLDNAINGVVKGIFAATGQTCLAGSRLFLHESIHDEFVDRLADRAADITLGNPLDHETQMGPVAFREQWEKVRDYIDVGVEAGATVAFGGTEPTDVEGELFVQPTILVDVENDMRVAQEEIFGPVVSVMTFADEAEVIERANDSRYGLAAGVWTENMRRAHRVSRRIEAGTVFVNEYRTLSYRSPFGGYKDSGLGRELGSEGLEEYLQTKSIWIDLAGEVSDPFSLG